jgi:Resolvase, N terminal domain/Recombinase
MKTAYSYLRWSTGKQGETDRDSRKRQTESVERWIKDYGKGEYTLSTQTFVDAGRSGFKGKHIEKDEYGRAKGELMRFIQLVEEGKIKPDSILCIDSFDRFSRLPAVKSLNLFLQVINSGIGLVFTGSFEKRIINADLINKEGYVLQFIIGELIRSTAESEEKSRKIKSAKQNKKNRMINGEIVAHNNIPKYFTFKDGKYIHNENTKIVKELIEGILGGESLYGLADSLNGRKVRTFRYGYQWSGNSIRQILRNRTLIGEYLGVKDFVPAITDVDTFNRLQNILDHNRKFNRGQSGNLKNIFRGVCFCADCGASMTVQASAVPSQWNQKEKLKYRYLKCSVIGANVDCKNRKSFRLDDMELEFFLHFLFKNPLQLLNDGDNKELKELKKNISTNQTKLANITKEIEKLVLLTDVLPMDELKTKLAKLNGQRNTLKGEIDFLNQQITAIQDAPDVFHDLKQLIADTQEFVEYLEPDGRITTSDTTPFIEYGNQIDRIKESLKDSYVREGIRVLLPTLVGKIKVDTMKGQFFVYNRMGKLIFESSVFESKRNNSDKWFESIRKTQKRKKKA